MQTTPICGCLVFCIKKEKAFSEKDTEFLKFSLVFGQKSLFSAFQKSKYAFNPAESIKKKHFPQS